MASKDNTKCNPYIPKSSTIGQLSASFHNDVKEVLNTSLTKYAKLNTIYEDDCTATDGSAECSDTGLSNNFNPYIPKRI